ncbi:MAG: hypothetical protein JXA58_00540 [Dehalococcoidia bacterium]|nr:hypothetical protein [Dehalococcoidia bacterium]
MKRSVLMLSSLGLVACIVAAVTWPCGGAVVLSDDSSTAGNSAQGQQVRFVDPAKVAFVLLYCGSPAPEAGSITEAVPDRSTSGYSYSLVTPLTRIAPWESPMRVLPFRPTWP